MISTILAQALPAVPDSVRTQLRNWRENFRLEADVVLPKLVQVAGVLLVIFLAYRLSRVVLNRIIAREVEEDDPIVKRLRQQRIHTVAGLLGNVLLVVFIIIGAITTLSTLGFPIGPILASVGVLGLAVSFGAQSLVKDVISGTFMLLEGQFGLGDVVRISDVSGMVERITLRTTVLRDLHGAVHIIPNGEITRVTNLTKAWSRSVLDISVAYKEDVDRVIAVLKEEGELILQDPTWGELLLDPPEVLGIDNFADSGVVIRMVSKTLPLKQWEVGRELRRRIKKRFDAEGIEIPFPHVTFYWGEGQSPPAPGSTASHQ